MLDQLLSSPLIVALLAAIFTAIFNNYFEEGRLKRIWERERQARSEQYRRQRYEEQLQPISDWATQVVKFADFVREAGHLAYPFDNRFGQEIPQLRSETANVRGFLQSFQSDLSRRAFTMSEAIEASRPQILAGAVSVGDGSLAKSIEACTDLYRGLHGSLTRLGDEIREALKPDSPISDEKALAVQQALQRIRNEGAMLIMAVAAVNQNIDRILTSLEVIPLSEIEPPSEQTLPNP